jgi:phenylacetate-CoA ligase
MSTVAALFDHRLDALQDQLAHVAEIPFYREFYADHGDPTAVSSVADLQELPFTDTKTIMGAFDEHPPHGSFFTEDVRQINMTPAGDDLMPEYNSEADIERLGRAMGEQYETMGVAPGDKVFIGGLAAHYGLQEAGGAVIPVGPGDSEQAAGMAQRLDANVIQAFPSFGLKIAEAADVELDLFIGGGEPFTSIPGLREDVRSAFAGDPTVVDVYALSEIVPVAAECHHENGLHVFDDHVFVEVIDPETEEPVEPGERGEIVLTHLGKEAMPLVRYRTGDLTRVAETTCGCGRSLTLPEGVFGRVDNRLKLKGVKFYPGSIGPVLVEFPDLTGEYVVEASRPDETDHLRIVAELEAGGSVDTEALEAALRRELVVGPDEVEVVTDLDADETVRDQRY